MSYVKIKIHGIVSEAKVEDIVTESEAMLAEHFFEIDAQVVYSYDPE